MKLFVVTKSNRIPEDTEKAFPFRGPWCASSGQTLSGKLCCSRYGRKGKAWYPDGRSGAFQAEFSPGSLCRTMDMGKHDAAFSFSGSRIAPTVGPIRSEDMA